MVTRRALLAGLGSAALARPASGGPSNRLALLLAAPWKGETWLENGIARMQAVLQARGLSSADTIASAEPLDRKRLLRRLGEVNKRIASWRQGELFLFFDGHGMYARTTGAVPEPGLQLTGDREDPNSALLWRELWDTLKPPPAVRVLAVPDCCHTNLLAGRLPPNVTALIIESTPQDSLLCRTGGTWFGEGPARKRYGVITYYAATTLPEATTAASWLTALHAAADRDVTAGTLGPARRPHLLVEGDATALLPGRPVATAAARTPAL